MWLLYKPQPAVYSDSHLTCFSLVPQAVSIADKEVFAFRMVNYTDATEGDAYLDMSKVDTFVTLTVGCIQVIFLNKFVSSILVRTTHSWHRLRKILQKMTSTDITTTVLPLLLPPIYFSRERYQIAY